MPREHGAYAELGFPLCAALALGNGAAAAWVLAAAAMLAFLAYEPLAVSLGHRGTRARREQGWAARRAVAVRATGTVAAAIGGVLASEEHVRAQVLVGGLVWIAAAGVAGAFVLARGARTLPGEVAVAAALSASALPVALAGGVAPAPAWSMAAVWAAGYGVSTLAVHRVIDRTKGRAAPGQPARITGAAVAVVALAAVAAGVGVISWWVPAGLAPLCAFAAVLTWAPVPARRLKAVGWSLVGASTVTLALLLAGLGALGAT